MDHLLKLLRVNGVFSRRDFLKVSSLSISARLIHAYAQKSTQAKPLFWGRVVFIYATLYSRPSIYKATGIIHELDSIVPIYGELEGEDENAINRRWYSTGEGYIHSSNVQPVQNLTNAPQAITGPTLGEVSVPFVDALIRAQPGAAAVYRLYFSSTHWIQETVTGSDSSAWYAIRSDRYDRTYFIPAETMRVIPAAEFSPLAPAVANKRIQINTTAETITAFENERPVFTTRISSGGSFGDGKDFRTPLGDYIIDRKRPSRHMAAGDGAADDAYDLPGVPWVSYFNGGIAIHGTYWHNDYGRPWSHGCINVLSQDAKWFYRWSAPDVPLGSDLLEARGTQVTVV
jgi:L,D-transpeptidase catalytic domain